MTPGGGDGLGSIEELSGLRRSSGAKELLIFAPCRGGTARALIRSVKNQSEGMSSLTGNMFKTASKTALRRRTVRAGSDSLASCLS